MCLTKKICVEQVLRSSSWHSIKGILYISIARDLLCFFLPLRPPTALRHHPQVPQRHRSHSRYRGKGSSSHYLYHSQNHQSDYKPYLKQDLKHQSAMTFNEFLNDVLHLAPDWIDRNASRISDIAHIKGNGNMLSKYREPVTHKTSRYPPFIILVNHILDQLHDNPDSNICFCHNDPVLVGDSCAERKPDVVGVRNRSLEVSERSSVHNLMKDGPDGACFWWTKLCCTPSSNSFAKSCYRIWLGEQMNPPLQLHRGPFLNYL
jgi:hypothetical protein